MLEAMASGAQCDQISLGVVARVAPKATMVELEILCVATDLAAPVVALKNALA